MIDWVSCSVPYLGPPVGVCYLKQERWDAPIEPAFNRPLQVEGSFSSKMTVHSIGARLYLSGNPVKWLSGQNAVGTDDLHKLIRLAYDEVMRRLDLPACLQMQRALSKMDVALTRVDCTFAYKVGSDDDVVSWLKAMEGACHVRYRGRGHFNEGMCSLMFGLTQKEGEKPKGSRSSSFKFYNKFREMKVHAPHVDADALYHLNRFVWGTVRGEACYRGMELKRLGYANAAQWTKGTALELHRMWVDRMEMAETFSLKSTKEKELPRRLQATYHLWRSGVRVETVVSRATFYSHRKQLLDGFGIDISAPSASSDVVQVVPILRVLEAKPVDETEGEALFWDLVKKAA